MNRKGRGGRPNHHPQSRGGYGYSQSYRRENSDSGSVTNDVPNSCSVNGIYNDHRTTVVMCSILGSPTVVKTRNGSKYQGTTKGISHEGDIALADAGVEKKKNTVGGIIIEKANIVSIKAVNVDLNGSAEASSDSFLDNGIAKLNGAPETLNGRELRELTPFDFDGEANPTLSLDDKSKGWEPHEMFSVNKERFNVKTSYDESLLQYTTSLPNPDSEGYEEKRRFAAKQAEEIERSETYQRRISKELDDGDEESKYSAVHRPRDSKPSENGAKAAYVAPAFRDGNQNHGRRSDQRKASPFNHWNNVPNKHGSSKHTGPPPLHHSPPQNQSHPQRMPPMIHKGHQMHSQPTSNAPSHQSIPGLAQTVNQPPPLHQAMSLKGSPHVPQQTHIPPPPQQQQSQQPLESPNGAAQATNQAVNGENMTANVIPAPVSIPPNVQPPSGPPVSSGTVSHQKVNHQHSKSNQQHAVSRQLSKDQPESPHTPTQIPPPQQHNVVNPQSIPTSPPSNISSDKRDKKVNQLLEFKEFKRNFKLNSQNVATPPEVVDVSSAPDEMSVSAHHGNPPSVTANDESSSKHETKPAAEEASSSSVLNPNAKEFVPASSFTKTSSPIQSTPSQSPIQGTSPMFVVHSPSPVGVIPYPAARKRATVSVGQVDSTALQVTGQPLLAQNYMLLGNGGTPQFQVIANPGGAARIIHPFHLDQPVTQFLPGQQQPFPAHLPQPAHAQALAHPGSQVAQPAHVPNPAPSPVQGQPMTHAMTQGPPQSVTPQPHYNHINMQQPHIAPNAPRTSMAGPQVTQNPQFNGNNFPTAQGFQPFSTSNSSNGGYALTAQPQTSQNSAHGTGTPQYVVMPPPQSALPGHQGQTYNLQFQAQPNPITGPPHIPQNPNPSQPPHIIHSGIPANLQQVAANNLYINVPQYPTPQ